MPRLAPLILAALLGGCGGADPPVGGVSGEEAAQLNDAAAMLDAEANEVMVNDVGD